MGHSSPVLVMGAGAIGCFVGGALAAAGTPVTLVGRARVLDAIAQHGLTLTDFDGSRKQVPAAALTLATTVPADARPELVLLCVKSSATAEAAGELAALAAATPVLSLQNGMDNAEVAQRAAPALRCLPAMVPFNVVEAAPGVWHRGTPGRIAVPRDAVLLPWEPVFAASGLQLAFKDDIRAVQWGKLLINLNNPVNALCGLPLRDEFLHAGWRRCFAALMEEGFAVLAAAGIAPARFGPVTHAEFIRLLRLPTPQFEVEGARMLRIDAKARSSMADDVARGRRTEIDALCGELVRLARQHGCDAPRNARMIALIDGNWPSPPPRLTAAELLAELDLSA